MATRSLLQASVSTRCGLPSTTNLTSLAGKVPSLISINLDLNSTAGAVCYSASAGGKEAPVMYHSQHSICCCTYMVQRTVGGHGYGYVSKLCILLSSLALCFSSGTSSPCLFLHCFVYVVVFSRDPSRVSSAQVGDIWRLGLDGIWAALCFGSSRRFRRHRRRPAKEGAAALSCFHRILESCYH